MVRDVIKAELFDQILCWQQGLDYQVIALQAVMANLLKGDTIHHACGIPVRKKGSDGEMVLQTHKDVAEQSLYWRWLLIDEFGMVGSSLLAEIDMKLRDVVVDVNPYKKSGGGHAHPFGGLNVLLSGDLWQLPPPSGGFLGSIPAEFIANSRKYSPAVTISHGQSLLWGGAQNSKWAFHGITELEESERCRKDPWLQEVQLELRQGRLSENSHAFLHGTATTVTGSWTNGVASCGRGQCQQLSEENASWDRIQACERMCSICTEARHQRKRVATDADDTRFTETKFVDAPAIFPNNDIKYDVNKQRARQYAAAHRLGVTWVQAQDKPLPKTLQERPDLVLQKMAWLSRHDRECGDLYGMLPLIEGLPVALTDHLDRNPDKQLLRGRIGTIHSWKVAATEESVWEDDVRILQELPEVVYVKFEGCKWHIEGTPEPGIYPITNLKRNWYLDKGRMYPQLAVQRKQFPLAPAFSWTAHTAQGQTLEAAIVDMQIGAGTSPMASYVAFTRVTKMEDLLIFRPFDRALFNQGNLEGPELLLRVLRGEEVDWQAVEAKHMPSHMCCGCDTKCFKAEFSEGQWRRKDGRRHCKECEQTESHHGLKKQCQSCGGWHPESMFEAVIWRKRDPSDRFCNACGEKRTCRGCGTTKIFTEFSKGEWIEAGQQRVSRGRCLECAGRHQTDPLLLKKCMGLCGESLPEMCFTKKMWKKVPRPKIKCQKCCKAGKDTDLVDEKECQVCHKVLSRSYFTDGEWRSFHGTRKCRSCQTGPNARQGQWTCIRCKETKPRALFQVWMAAKKTEKAKHCKCNVCWLREVTLAMAVQSSNSEHVTKTKDRK